jgi:hypothetical protein
LPVKCDQLLNRKIQEIGPRRIGTGHLHAKLLCCLLYTANVTLERTGAQGDSRHHRYNT